MPGGGKGLLESESLHIENLRLEARWLGPPPERAPTLVFLHEGHFRLGGGEAEALALATESKEPAAVVATDDRNAIRACKVLRVTFVTSLGILSRAVEKGLVSREDGVRSLEKLRSYGRFRTEVIEEVLRQIKGAKE